MPNAQSEVAQSSAAVILPLPVTARTLCQQHLISIESLVEKSCIDLVVICDVFAGIEHRPEILTTLLATVNSIARTEYSLEDIVP